MTAITRALALALAAGALAAGTTAAQAGGAIALTDGQLDHVTAGEATVSSSVDAQAIGALTLTGTSSTSIVAGGAPYPGQPGLTDTAGAADGTAVALGTNRGRSGPPTASSPAVTTGGSAAGNQVTTSNFNYSVQGAGGVTFQTGWTFVAGSWVGL